MAFPGQPAASLYHRRQPRRLTAALPSGTAVKRPSRTGHRRRQQIMSKSDRIDVYLVAGGKYHNIDHARLELLRNCWRSSRGSRSAWGRLQRHRCHLRRGFPIITYTCDVIPARPRPGACRDYINAGGNGSPCTAPTRYWNSRHRMPTATRRWTVPIINTPFGGNPRQPAQCASAHSYNGYRSPSRTIRLVTGIPQYLPWMTNCI